jgi:hypothetical protein
LEGFRDIRRFVIFVRGEDLEVWFGVVLVEQMSLSYFVFYFINRGIMSLKRNNTYIEFQSLLD